MKRMILMSLCLSTMVIYTVFAGDPAIRRAILFSQDQRDGSSLAGLFSNPDEDVRASAIIAAGSVQDTNHISMLIHAAGDDPSPAVRAAAVFALGQMTSVIMDSQRRLISRFLTEATADESAQQVLIAATQALGKCGDQASLSAIVRQVQFMNNEIVRNNTALAIGRYAYRGMKDREATAFAAGLLTNGDGVSWEASYAMMRIAADSLLRPFAPVMEEAMQIGAPEARMYLAAALGSASVDHAVPLLIDAAKSDSDWRVRVNAVRSLALINSEEGRQGVLDLVTDQSEHVSLTALTTAAGFEVAGFGSAVRTTFRTVLNDRSLSARQRGAAAFALASLFRDSVAGDLGEAYRHGICPERDYIRSLGMLEGDNSFRELLRFARSTNPESQRGALDALTADVTPERNSQVEQVLYVGIQSSDMAVMTTAAAALEDSMFHSSGTVQVISQRLADLRLPHDVEPMLAMVQTLGAIGSEEAKPLLLELLQAEDRTVALGAAAALESIDGRSYLAEIPARSVIQHTDYDWDYLERLTGAQILVDTEAGRFTFELLPGEAPFTCINFARLIEQGFYDGLIFHRVVPNFVVQGGDPRGDGWGGPGYSIRSEFGTFGYEAGMVGVASAGKDTEGCQFFVTHSKQPHLDGRYTIFGRITAGMEVVDQIQMGDRILRMKVERE